MTKKEAIQRFKDAINNEDIHRFRGRKNAVENQFSRTTWQTSNDNGLFKIEDSVNGISLTFSPTAEFAKEINIESSVVFELTKSEYLSLRKLYFGNFTPNYRYLREIGALPPKEKKSEILWSKV